jgi:hypothetical protein
VYYHEIYFLGIFSFTMAPAGQISIELLPVFGAPDDVRIVRQALANIRCLLLVPFSLA